MENISSLLLTFILTEDKDWSSEYIGMPLPCCPSPIASYVGAGNLVKLNRARDKPLQILVLNEEFLVRVYLNKSSALATFLPFVHTFCHYY